MSPEVLAALIAAVPAVLGVPPLYLSLRRKRRVLEAVQHQVQNSHTTNLRDDVDRVIELVELSLTGQDGLRQDMALLREDLGLERRERMSLENRVDGIIEGRVPLAS